MSNLRKIMFRPIQVQCDKCGKLIDAYIEKSFCDSILVCKECFLK